MNETMKSDKFINQQIKTNNLNTNFNQFVNKNLNKQNNLSNKNLVLDNKLKYIEFNKSKYNNYKTSKRTNSVRNEKINDNNFYNLKKDDNM